jgi:hypothetical protein
MRTWLSKFLIVISGLCPITWFVSCNELKKNKSHAAIADDSIYKGKKLAAVYCSSCHKLPDPSELDANSWEKGVLPAMGPHLGIFSYGFQKYQSSRYDKNLPLNFYPPKPVLNNLEWQNIIDYYTALSPDSLPGQQRPDMLQSSIDIFKVVYAPRTYSPPAICCTKIDTSASPKQLLLFDLSGIYLLRYDNQLKLIDSTPANATITDIDINSKELLACNINFINPNNARLGKAQLMHTNANGGLSIDTAALFGNLARPVQITSCDLNNDQRTDYLVCEFGNQTGALSWVEGGVNGIFTHHILRAQPGAIKAYVEDYNHDGLLDVWALFSQAEEGIFLFTNKGNGKFEEQSILRFPSVFGSTYFEFADVNKDGLQDIIYTCGDNADYSMILKPYHGVYIFLNEGSNEFKQKYFFPINGCYKAMARDYDGDGDIDIASIAFFADFAAQPGEGFVYLKNKGNLEFEPYTIPETKTGRWLTMDAGDLDGDGKTDIVLSNFSVRPSVIKPTVDWQNGPSFIFLRNISK